MLADFASESQDQDCDDRPRDEFGAVSLPVVCELRRGGH